MTDEKYIDKIMKSRKSRMITFGDFLGMDNYFTSADMTATADRMVMMSTPMGGGGNIYYDEPTQSLHVTTLDGGVIPIVEASPSPWAGLTVANEMSDAVYQTVNIGDL